MSTNRFLTLVSGVRRVVTAISASSGVADANKVIATGSDGRIDPSLVPATPYLLYADIQSSGTNGPAAVSGSWATLPLNTELHDTKTLGSLVSNEITLAAGTYEFVGRSQFYGTDRTQIRLYNVSDAVVVPNQESECGFFFSSFSASGWLTCQGRITLAAAKTLRLEYHCETSNSIGLGVATSFGPEHYRGLRFSKVL